MKSSVVVFLLVLTFFLVGCGIEEVSKKEVEKVDSNLVKSNNKTTSVYIDPALPPSPDYSGDHVVKYSTGITSMRGFFRFGKKHGKWAAFFPSGDLQSETEFENGKKNGKITVWYNNGKVMYEGEFKDDVRSGIWKTYDTLGVLLETKKY